MDNAEGTAENTKCVVDVQFGEYVEFDHVPDAFEMAKAIEMCLNASMLNCLIEGAVPVYDHPVQVIVRNELEALVDASRAEYSGACGSPAMVNFMQLMREGEKASHYMLGVRITATYLVGDDGALPDRMLRLGEPLIPLYRFKQTTEVEKV